MCALMRYGSAWIGDAATRVIGATSDLPAITIRESRSFVPITGIIGSNVRRRNRAPHPRRQGQMTRLPYSRWAVMLRVEIPI
jgi:hypothetical protein